MYGLSELFEVVPTSVPSTPTGTTATAFGENGSHPVMDGSR